MQSNPLNLKLDSGQFHTNRDEQARNQDYLSKELEDEKVIQALNSAEGINETEAPKTEKTSQGFLPNNLDMFGTIAASALHIITWLSRTKNIMPKKLSNSLDKIAPKFSKFINLLNYSDKALISFKANNALDAISKALFPIVVSFVPLENMFLAAGLSSGTTMMSGAHNPRINDDRDKSSFWVNLKRHFTVYREMCSETLSKGGFKKLVSKKDRHLMFNGGNMNFFGGLGGLIFNSNPLLKNYFSAIRNICGIVCDFAKIAHGDFNYLVSGILYIVTHVLDMWQTAIEKTDHEKARTISHFVQGVNSVANYFYINPSKTQADGSFKDDVKERMQVAYAMG